jgi:predicted nucleic-acid-binding Zn-ribbon protein
MADTFVSRPDEGCGMVPTDSSASADDRGCPKCGHTETDVGSISTTGGGLSKVFDIQTNRFRVVSCLNCGYSELYRDTRSGASDIVDVFLG